MNKNNPRMRHLFIFFCILGYIFNATLHSQEFNLRFDSINIEQGLSQSSVFSICQDYQGFLWFGTEAGLNKYDGYAITIYMPDAKDPNSLTNNYIYSLLEDSQKVLWVGTDNGLNRYDRKLDRFQQYFHQASNATSLSGNRVYRIYEDHAGTIWVGTDQGLNQFDRQNDQFICFLHDEKDPSSLSHNTIRAIFEDHSGILWIGTDNGLNRYDRKNKSFQHYYHQADNAFSLSDSAILAIHEDKDKELWIGTARGGLNRFDRKKNQFTAFTSDPQNPRSLNDVQVNAIYEDSLGRLWFGTQDGGINRFHKDSQTFTHYTGATNTSGSQLITRIFCIFEDRSGVLWFGGYGNGAIKVNIETEKFIHYKHDSQNPNSLSHAHSRAFFEDSLGYLWVGNDGAGLDKIDRKTGIFKHYQHQPGNPASISENKVFAIHEDEKKIFWLGTYGGGLNRFDARSERFYQYRYNANDSTTISDDRIRTICPENNDIFWVGTDGGGLNKFDRRSGKFTRFPIDRNDGSGLSHNRIFRIIKDRFDGTLLICTFGGGLNRFDPRTERFSYYRNNPDDANSISNDYVLCIYQTQAGIIWIGSNGGGLTRLDPKTNQFKSYSEADGLCNNAIYGILEDRQKFLWMSSNKGISRFNPQLESFKNYDVSDGLQSNEFNGNSYYLSAKGEMFFGGINGFNSFFPEKIKDNPHVPPVVITDFKLFNQALAIGRDKNSILKQAITMTNEIRLSYADNVFTIDFAALHFVFPSKNEFQYRMINFDKDWTRTSSQKRFATYTNLDPGSYVFQVRAANNDGLWNEEGTKLKIVIVPPFTRTLLFKILMVLLVVLLILLYLNFRMRNMRIQQQKLEALVNERTRDLELEVIERKQAQLDQQKANEIAEKARTIAEGANQAKSMFLARMSHEIRTPMNSVIGFSDMLIDTTLSEEQTEYVRNIIKSGEALLSIINEILDFSMIEAGRMALQVIDFDLEITAFDICQLVRPRLENKPVEILCRIGDNVPAFIKGDAGRIRQMLVNLMTNAAKFTHAGEIELFVDVSQENDNQLKLQGFVRDTGIGIAQEKRELIFEVFQQADGSTTRKYGGTGLGLAICRQIAHLHKGEIWVESEINKGSTFHFTAWMEKSAKKIEKKPPIDFLAGKRAIIVDDNINNLDILNHILQIYHMTAIPLNRGAQMIPTLEEEFDRGAAIHLCILDIQMPEFSGYDVARLVRQHKDPRIAAMPLLAFSSSTSKRTRMYRESGFDGFLPKPVQRQKLITMMKRLLGEKTENDEKSDKQMVITQHSLAEEAKHSISILLAEDNPLNQKLAVFMLSKAGYHLDVVETGKDAVDRFVKNPMNYDLIFMDIHMPEMDGLEATRLIREQGHKDIPIIAMTADAMKEDREKCIAAGMNDYIAKPIKRDVVFNIIRQWVFEREK